MSIASPALVLNADFQPLSIFPPSLWCWEDTVKAVVKGSVAVVAEYDRVVRSPSIAMRLPSVVALREYKPAPKRVAFTRFNVFVRDRLTCQYCGNRFSVSDLTFDHVVPRSRGGKTCWENIVAACEPCNTAKDNQVGHPIRPPRKPNAQEMIAAQRSLPQNFLHESWIDYLYWDSELQR